MERVRPDWLASSKARESTGLGRGSGAQLLSQEALQLLILAEGGSRLPGSGEEADQLAVRFFPQGVRSHRAPGPLDGAGVIVGLLQGSRQLLERMEEQFCQPLPLGQNPVLKVARQQL